ncbi:MAG: SPFH domain-containing protein [Anaerolineae bacterium]
MKRLMVMLARLVGIHPCPDNHIIPVFRLGRFQRVGRARFVLTIPLIEQALPPVKTSIHVGDFTFNEILTKNNVPFKIQMTVLFTFNPNSALKSAAAELVRGGNELLKVIVKDYANQGLRRLVSKYEASELGSQQAMTTIERTLTRFLLTELRPLGLAPLKEGGVLIKELIAPAEFKQSILDARRLEAILYTLAGFPMPGLVEQAIRAGFVTGLERLESNVFLSNLPSLETGLLSDWLNNSLASVRNGQHHKNGH